MKNRPAVSGSIRERGSRQSMLMRARFDDIEKGKERERITHPHEFLYNPVVKGNKRRFLLRYTTVTGN